MYYAYLWAMPKDNQKGLTDKELIAKYGHDKTDFKTAIKKMAETPCKTIKSDKQAAKKDKC